MKIAKHIFILSTAIMLPCVCFAQSANLDEVYRQIIKANNQDYLPMFVKNREEPNFLKDVESVENLAKSNKDALSEINQIVDFEDKGALLKQEERAKELKWQAIILAVQQNKLTPYDIEEIQKRIKNKDPQAIEIFAFMNAKGIGVYQDLIKSFLLYQEALNLDVDNAKNNAILVYNSMSRDQKKKLKAISQRP